MADRELPALLPQNFTSIASALPHKSFGDCVQYYYRRQFSDNFAAVRRKW